MITERDIAEKFSHVWKQHFPLLTPAFIRVFNESHAKLVNTSTIEVDSNVRYDLVSELAFNTSHYCTSNGCTPSDIIDKDKEKLSALIDKTSMSIWKSGNFEKEDLILNELEIEQCRRISDNILEFISFSSPSDIHFKPLFKGYGYLNQLEGDLIIDKTLIEVKTVNRNFRSSDLKQLLLYLALDHASNLITKENASLYNPRTGKCIEFKTKNLVYNISGGKSTNEAFSELLESLTREVQLDSRF